MSLLNVFNVLNEFFIFFNEVIAVPLINAILVTMTGDRPYQQVLARGMMWTQEYYFNTTRTEEIVDAYCTSPIQELCTFVACILAGVVNFISYVLYLILVGVYLLLIPMDTLANYAFGLDVKIHDNFHLVAVIAFTILAFVQSNKRM